MIGKEMPAQILILNTSTARIINTIVYDEELVEYS